MTTQQQKELELIYARKAGDLLNESWKVESSPDEVSWPDLIVTTESGKFGLEVREIYLDESAKGSDKKANEKNNLKKIKKLADSYYKANCSSIKADLLGDISHHDELMNVIICEAPQLSEFEQRRIEPYSDCVVYIRKLPDRLGEYKRWRYVSDKLSWVSNIDKVLIDKAINGKAKNLPKYVKNISEVSLLLASDRVFNSGRVRFVDGIKCNSQGFKDVYYLSYPESAWKLGS